MTRELLWTETLLLRSFNSTVSAQSRPMLQNRIRVEIFCKKRNQTALEKNDINFREVGILIMRSIHGKPDSNALSQYLE
ncbi:hypothetical protein KC19_VG163800 [Ceratodon purpureus]|uniref:Uncharacterized protein n=1 Tax=Ceratodon purpureus TaxID=3225 RepID=A0A8T0HQQ2_CERPU|nr:hypothetical protein KC19_VG163800 [Ceratodon purpureus]